MRFGIVVVLRRGRRALLRCRRRAPRLGFAVMLRRGLRALHLGFTVMLRRGFRASRFDIASMIFISLASEVWALHLTTYLQ